MIEWGVEVIVIVSQFSLVPHLLMWDAYITQTSKQEPEGFVSVMVFGAEGFASDFCVLVCCFIVIFIVWDIGLEIRCFLEDRI